MPRPSHARQRPAGCRPAPPQRLHVVVNSMCPRTTLTLPVPSHATQSSAGAGLVPVPAHASQPTSRLQVRVWRLGASTSASGTTTVVWRSAPRAGRPGWRRRHERAAEEIAEGGGALGVNPCRKIEPGEPRGTSRRRRRFAVVVALAAVRIDQRLVGRQDVAEARRRFAIARIDVGMESAREALVGAPDVLRAGLSPDAEHEVEIHDVDYGQPPKDSMKSESKAVNFLLCSETSRRSIDASSGGILTAPA